MAEFAIGFDLRGEMWHGIVKFADKNQRWRADYEKLLRDLGVTLQIWYLFRSQWPPAPDRIVIYTQADNLEVMQRFYSTLASGTSAISRDCWHTCQVGTCGADWYPSPPASPLPTGWSIVFTYP
jgi:hypothetical protein